MILVLVNGTFAPRAAWTRESSRFVQKLKSSLGARVIVSRFNWSGNNSHRARVRAGGKLGRYLLRLRSENATSQIYIIGHSHGGNVAGYALRNNRVAKCVSGVVFMATPFIEIERRDLAGAVKLLGWTLPILIAPAFCISLVLLLAFAADYEDSRLKMWAEDQTSIVRIACAVLPWASLLAGAPLVGWLLVKAGKYLGGPFRTRMLIRFREYQLRRSEELAWLSESRNPALILRISGDEAGLGLKCLHTLSEVLPRVWRLAATVSFALVALVIFSYAAVVFGGSLLKGCANLVSYLPFSAFLKESPEGLLLWSLVVLFLWIVSLLILQAAMAVAPLFIRAHRFGFGGETVFDNWLLRIRAVAQPTQLSFVSFREFSLDSLGKQLSWRFKHKLRHSVYEQEDAIAMIVEWLRSHRGHPEDQNQ